MVATPQKVRHLCFRGREAAKKNVGGGVGLVNIADPGDSLESFGCNIFKRLYIFYISIGHGDQKTKNNLKPKSYMNYRVLLANFDSV